MLYWIYAHNFDDDFLITDKFWKGIKRPPISTVVPLSDV